MSNALKIDENQKKAVYAKDTNMLICACPGSGKTQVIVNRVNYLVSDLKVKEENIIVLTFTKAAATNMKNRYLKLFNKSTSPFFGTFHGLFYQILLKQGLKIKIIESYVVNGIISGVLKEYSDEVTDDKIKEIINEISLFNSSRTKIENYIGNVPQEILTKCYVAYTDYKKKNNLLDFDDLAILTLKLLENKKYLEGYRNIFKHILVDEFQDCDDLQIEFLKLMNKKNSLFAVGDEDQCIYSFRGSKPEYMVSFNEIFRGGKKYYLAKNYRSNKNIVESSKDLISFNKERNEKTIVPNKKEEGIIRFETPVDEKIQSEKIVMEIKNLTKNKGYEYHDNMILYRTNMESMSIVDTLIRLNIPFSMLDKEYNLYNNFICKDLIAYLTFARDPYNRDAFLKIINKPFRYVSKTDSSYVRDYRENINPFDILIQRHDTPPFKIKIYQDLKRDFTYINKASLGSAIQYIVMDLGYIDYLKSYGERFNTSILDLEEVVEAFKESAKAFKTITEFFEHIDNVSRTILENKGKNINGRVLLSTIHGVKGMEFKNVFIMNCSEDTIPHRASKNTNIEEERRLFYVGITRAIDNLYLYSPKTRRGTFKEVSRFIKEGGFLKDSMITCGLKIGDKIFHKSFGHGEIIRVDKKDITITFDDGKNRKFSSEFLMDNNLIIVIK